jgi:hypothetical protein
MGIFNIASLGRFLAFLFLIFFLGLLFSLAFVIKKLRHLLRFLDFVTNLSFFLDIEFVL